MSIRIDSDKLQGASTPQTGQTSQVRSNANGASIKSGVQSTGRDTVEMSSMAEGIADASSTQNAQNAERIRHLSQLYSSGQYQVDSVQLSRSLVANAVAGPGAAGE